MTSLLRDLAKGLRLHALTLLVLIAAGAAFTVLFTGGIWAASQSPEFCTTCHYMDPFYRQWQTSSHADVSCVECHPVRPLANAVSALRYLTDTYDTRPRAEVASASCLQAGCHDGRLEQHPEAFGGQIQFEHATHLDELRRGKRLQCTSCHSQIVQGEHIAVTEETCFLCHFKDAGEGQAIGGCTNCHGTPGESVQHGGFVFRHDTYLEADVACEQCHLEVVRGDGVVPAQRCYDCHVERLERYDDSAFMHATHVTEHDVDCFACHEKIEHGDVRLIRALDTSCEKCHQALHSPQKEMYLGTGARGVHELPSRMFAARVSCDGCHTQAVHLGSLEFDEVSLEAERQSCVDCHGSGYDDMLDDWLREMGHLNDVLGPEVAQAEAVLARREAAGDAADDLTVARLQVQNARHNLDLLRGGRGAHNVEYAVRLTQAAARSLDKAMPALDADYRPPRRPPLVSTPDGYCTALCHARIGLPEETEFEHMVFPHSLHAEDIEVECTVCHSPDKHKKQIITRTGCMSCHHEAEDIDCAHCHPATVALYTGEAADWGVEEGYPDFMADAEITCTECHDLTAELDIADLQTGCIDCHDEDYGPMLAEWINETQDTVGEVQAELAGLQSLLGRRRDDEARAAAAQLQAVSDMTRLIDLGKGAHNYELSVDLLQQARERLAEVRAQLAPRSASK